MHDKIQVDRCGSCQGLWLDAMELQDLLKSAGSERIDTGGEREFRKTSQVEDYLCPKDGARMIKMVHHRQHHVWYESCNTCYGIFLDATEFTDLKGKSLMDLLRSFGTPERPA
jgi:Zn-finger nucleic acid-binding protein